MTPTPNDADRVIPNRASREQLLLLRYLNKAQVEYLAFGNVALNAYQPSTLIQDIQLWVKPTPDNLSKFNAAMDAAYGADTRQKLPGNLPQNPPAQRLLRLGDGQVKLTVYPAIAGFRATEFDALYAQSDLQKTTMQDVTGKRLDGSVGYRQLGFADLCKNVSQSTAFHKNFHLDTLAEWATKNNVAVPNQSAMKGFYNDTTRVNGKRSRDLDRIKEALDLEVVLQHYGFEQDTKKSSPNAVWRIYERGEKGSKERVAVAALQGYASKVLVDMNDLTGQNYGKGTIARQKSARVVDVNDFIASQEHGYGKAFFQKIDQMLGDPDYALKKQAVPERIALPAGYALRDTVVREMDLYNRYDMRPLENSAYLEGRALSKAVLTSIDVEGRIKTSRYTHTETGRAYTNTAFPLYAQDGRITSLDLRNKGVDGVNYKKFPTGERGEALWHTNRHYELQQPLTLSNEVTVPKGTIGSIYREDDNLHALFHYGTQPAQRLRLPLDRAAGDTTTLTMKSLVDGGVLTLKPLQRIVVSESAIDALSFKQLNPEPAGEFRQYVATAGQPGSKQLEFIQAMVTNNPTAQLVIAQDGDNSGQRFAINYLALQHPYMKPDTRIIPTISYIAPVHREKRQTEGEETRSDSKETMGKNRLLLEIVQPLGQSTKPAQQANESFLTTLVNDLALFVKKGPDQDSQIKQNRVTRVNEEKKEVVTTAEIYFPNDSKLLSKVLHHLERGITERQGQALLKVVRPTPVQKDFNEVLQQTKGKPLTESSNLKLDPAPVLLPAEQLQQRKQQEQQQAMQRQFTVNGVTSTIQGSELTLATKASNEPKQPGPRLHR